MSFSTDVKNEIMSVEVTSDCCRKAQAYGLLLFGKSFSADEMSVSLENRAVAAYYKKALDEYAGGSFAVRSSAAEKTKVRTVNRESAKKLFEFFSHTEKERSLRINWANIECDECRNSFLRGAFLTCGSVTTPSKGYHLEFSIPYLNLSRDFNKFLNELGFEPKQVVRNGYHILYFKDSEAIEDILTAMGAIKSSLELMDVKVYKDFRNHINRRTNFENANLSRTVEAEIAQKDAIRKIQRTVGLASLPEDLREVASLRLENDGVTLRELGDMCSPPLSRSGVNHRLKKIIDFANGIKE